MILVTRWNWAGTSLVHLNVIDTGIVQSPSKFAPPFTGTFHGLLFDRYVSVRLALIELCILTRLWLYLFHLFTSVQYACVKSNDSSRSEPSISSTFGVLQKVKSLLEVTSGQAAPMHLSKLLTEDPVMNKPNISGCLRCPAPGLKFLQQNCGVGSSWQLLHSYLTLLSYSEGGGKSWLSR